MDIGRMIANMQTVSITEVVADSLHNTRDKIAAEQRDQMLHGEKSKGKIGKYRSPAYAKKKFAMNALAGFGNVDLKLTGAFQGDIIVDVRDRSVVMDSGDAKAGSLIKKYGENIFGLNESRTGNYTRNHLQPEAVKLIKSKVLK